MCIRFVKGVSLTEGWPCMPVKNKCVHHTFGFSAPSSASSSRTVPSFVQLHRRRTPCHRSAWLSCPPAWWAAISGTSSSSSQGLWGGGGGGGVMSVTLQIWVAVKFMLSLYLNRVCEEKQKNNNFSFVLLWLFWAVSQKCTRRHSLHNYKFDLFFDIFVIVVMHKSRASFFSF